jgi:DNA-binding transcriptional ArsR family regulator
MTSTTTPVQVAAALADPARLALLAALLEGEATVTELAARLDLAQPRVSTHLARLRAVGLVVPVAMGRHRAYAVNAVRVKPLLDALYATGPGVHARAARRGASGAAIRRCVARAPATTTSPAWRASRCSIACDSVSG